MICKDITEFWKQRDPSEVKYGATFYGCHTALDTCCCEVKILETK
jgi:hypothetical protein